MAGQVPGSVTRVMGGLVEAAHAHRDGAINTLDAVHRQATAARAQIGTTVAVVPPPTQADLLAHGPAPRDTRFDPEDWDASRAANRSPAAVPPAAAPTRPVRTSRVADDSDDDYPETWLR